MFSKTIKGIMIGLSAAVLSVSASATVIFENGVDGDFYSGHNPFTYQVVTNSFSLADSATLTSLTYNAFTTDATVPVTDVLVEFYADNAGSLGDLLFSQHLSVAFSQIIGGDGYYDYTDYTVNLPSLFLGAGNYFLGLQVSPEQRDQHWSIPNNPVTGQSSDGFAHYFRLESDSVNVPEPSSILLIGLGLLGLGVVRSRKA